MYIDTNIAHDHTYYGNGCTNGWGADGTGGSDTPCETRIVETPGEEEQKNGTYYHFQAASSGSGAAVTTKYDSVPDTFCPLGWQVPYDGTGGDYYDTSKSWKFLLSSYSIPNDEGGARTLREYPFNISSSGRFSWEFGRLYNMPGSAWLWSGNAEAQIWARHFYVWGTGPGISTYQKYTGFTVRCILFLDANFIDGTEEGTDISLSDGNYFHDHTYYGNGCENEWGTGGSGGSTKACSTNKVISFDNEEQGIGVYYDYQAATSGTGAAIAAGNTDSPDTFCPLGWQLPYSGTGGDYYDRSKSWTNLFNIYSLAYQDGTAADATKVRSYPFSYVLSGYFSWYKGRLYNQTGGGNSWSQTLSGGNPHDFKVYQYGLKPVNASDKNSGFDIRYVNCFSILSSTARWKEPLVI